MGDRPVAWCGRCVCSVCHTPVCKLSPCACTSVQGTRRELLRALCQLVNTTGLTLEAALIDVEDSDWHVLAARSGGLVLGW